MDLKNNFPYQKAVGEKQQSKQNQLAENEMLNKQKKELIRTFKKQRNMTVINFKKKHKLTDILTRPKVKIVLVLQNVAER